MKMNILRRKEEIYKLIAEHKNLRGIGSELLSIALICFYIYGMMLGTFLGWNRMQQLGVVGFKMIVLAFGTTALTAPTLYVFSALRGSNITLKQFKLLLIGMLSIVSLVLLGFLPIVWFFMATTEQNVQFITVMNIIMMVIALWFGLWFLQNGIRYLYTEYKKKDDTTHSGLDVLLIWFIVFIAVAVQMYLELSPWFAESVTFFKS